MKSTAFVLSLLATVAIAQPHKHLHRAKHPLKARDDPVVEWVTEYEYTTEVVPLTTTIWVDEGFVPPETTSTSSPVAENTVPAQFFQPVPEPSSSSTLSTSTTSSVSVAPAPAATSVEVPPEPVVPSTSVQPTTSSTTPEEIVQPTTSTTLVVVTSQAPEPTVQATTSAAPVVSSTPSTESSSGSTSGECSEGSPCEGDITHYDANAGTGACGWNSDGKTENVVALSHVLMGTQSNGNPYCGKSITVKLNGKTTTAKVVDKCMGCEIHAIDLSEHAFSELEDMNVGRTQVEWYFN